MITAHTIIKNEENFIWYSINSVVHFVDKILIWDTGSQDKTVEIVKELVKIYPQKIDFREIGNVNEIEYSKVRQKMLDETKSGWIFILDGDEIWWEQEIKKVVEEIQKQNNYLESLIVPTINLVGDIFHFQESKAGQYKFGNRTGHYNLRFINREIPGLHVDEVYGKEGFFDLENKPIQNRNEDTIKFINAPYLHATHLKRSLKDIEVMQRSKKLKYEIGIEFPKDFYYPEIFFRERPDIVPDIWKNMDFNFKLRAFIETPLRKIKRRIK